jgi:hypothetical protein
MRERWAETVTLAQAEDRLAKGARAHPLLSLLCNSTDYALSVFEETEDMHSWAALQGPLCAGQCSLWHATEQYEICLQPPHFFSASSLPHISQA